MSSVADAATGQWGRITWAVDATGQTSARDYFYSLSQTDSTKLMALFKRLADFGQIHSREKFKKVTDDLWEFKSHQLRFIGDFRPGGVFVIAHGVRKKKDNIRPEDLARARRILAEHDARR